MKITYRLPSELFGHLPYALDVDLASPTPRSRFECPQQELRMLTVCRLAKRDRYKGCDKVIRAMPKVLSFIPNVKYYVVGEGALKEELENLAREEGVAEHVHFLGYLSAKDLEEVYRSSHIFVMPSIGEGFGIVFLEAWKYGLPVIAGNRDASPEVVTDGINGLTVNPESVEEISAAIVRILRDRSAAIKMSSEGYAKLIDRYTHEHFRETLSDILQDRIDQCRAL